MTIHLLLSVDIPVNWGTVIRAINSHRPTKVSLIHFPRINSHSPFNKAPRNMGKWLEELGVSISKYIVEGKMELEVDEAETLRLDVLSGATFAQIRILEQVIIKYPIEIWATPSIGSTCVRLDSDESFEQPHLDPLRALELSGKNASWEEVKPTEFDLGSISPYLTINKHKNHQLGQVFHYAGIDLKKMKNNYEFDNVECKLSLIDCNGKSLTLDAQERHGFWLEDIVGEVFSRHAIQSSAKAYRNFMINRPSVKSQLERGLKNILQEKVYKLVPIIRLEISEAFGIDPWRHNYESSKFKKQIGNLSTVIDGLRNSVSEYTYSAIFSAGAMNEFDLLMVGAQEITTIEVKTIKPSLPILAKLNTLINSQITPLKKRGIIVHGYFPIDEEEKESFRQEREVWKKLFPNISVIYWIHLPGIDMSNNPTNNPAKESMDNNSMHLEVLRWLTENNSPLLTKFFGVKKTKKGRWIVQFDYTKKQKASVTSVLNVLKYAIPELSDAIIERNKINF